MQPGGLHQVEQLVVVDDVEAGLGQPPPLQGDHAAQQLLEVGAVGGRVVVPEPHELALPPVREVVVRDVGEHLLDRAGAEPRVDRGHRAERAGEAAAPRRLDDARHEERARQQVVARRGQARRAGARLADVARAAAARRRRPSSSPAHTDSASPTTTASQCSQALVGREGGVRPAHRRRSCRGRGRASARRNASAAKPVKNDSATRSASVSRSHLLDLLVHDAHLVLRRRQRRQVDAGDRRDEVLLVPVAVARHVHDDDVDPHAPSGWVIPMPARCRPCVVPLMERRCSKGGGSGRPAGAPEAWHTREPATRPARPGGPRPPSWRRAGRAARSERWAPTSRRRLQPGTGAVCPGLQTRAGGYTLGA